MDEVFIIALKSFIVTPIGVLLFLRIALFCGALLLNVGVELSIIIV